MQQYANANAAAMPAKPTQDTKHLRSDICEIQSNSAFKSKNCVGGIIKTSISRPTQHQPTHKTTSLPNPHPPGQQLLTPLPPPGIHSLHNRSPKIPIRTRILHQQPLPATRIVLPPLLPRHRALDAIDIRIVDPDEGNPISLHERHDGRIGAFVARRDGARPDGRLFRHVGDAEARRHLPRVRDVVVVVPIAVGGRVRGRVLGGVVVEVEAGADVAEVAVGGHGGAPVFAGAGELRGLFGFGRVEGLDGGELFLREFGELRLQPGVAGVDGFSGGVRDEDGAFVADVAVDGGEFDEVAVAVEGEGVVGDEVVV